ncbi:E3 ubiquitin-protein ligase TRIM39-like [Ambystoma mexicanum]|uniref:E3 ubiquitin-protein ligase TRIM39-like n=1 Tax=Ambystoma mexicanum TaxID=8296 RepID=UPI0037E842B5
MAVVNLLAEVTCSICLEYFTDPVAVQCGHSFCRACISQYCKGLQSGASCPECRQDFEQGDFRPSRQLAKVVDISRQLSLKLKLRSEEGQCDEHEEKLKLFCEDDQRAICVVCRESRDHRSHRVVTILESVQEYKEKLQHHLDTLKKGLENLTQFMSEEVKRSEEIKAKIHSERKTIVSEFEKLHQFLITEQQALLGVLEDEETEILQKIEANQSRLSLQVSDLKQLIADMEVKFNQTSSELLKDIKATLKRCEEANLEPPMEFSYELQSLTYKVPQLCPTLNNMTQKMKVSLVDVTLNPTTAHSTLVLSSDLKSVKHGVPCKRPTSPERFQTSWCVLGAQGFSSGRCCWLIKVNDSERWAVGVAKESVQRKGAVRLDPEEGFWVIGLLDGQNYAHTFPEMTELPKERLKRIKIYLDYEGGWLSFFNADTMARLYTFTASFSKKIYPFFWLRHPDTEITLNS